MRTIEDLLGSGFGVALATPFLPEGQLDEAGLARLVRHVVEGGADFVVALGSTGEAAMLTEPERHRVVQVVAQNLGGRSLVVGTGATSTAQTIAWTKTAAELGADAALVAVPPYAKPTQAGLLAHFAAVAEAAPDLPLIAYNVPSRSSINMCPSTVRDLWRIPSLLALKESSGDLTQIAHIAATMPNDRALLAGDDALLLPTISVGGHGVVSVAGNVVPQVVRELLLASRAGDLERAQEQFASLLPLFDALNLESNPIPIKAALAMTGLCYSTLRLPLLPAQEATRAALQPALQQTRSLSTHA